MTTFTPTTAYPDDPLPYNQWIEYIYQTLKNISHDPIHYDTPIPNPQSQERMAGGEEDERRNQQLSLIIKYIKMNPLSVLLVVGFLAWLFYDFKHTPVTPDQPDDRDITERIYDDNQFFS